MGLDVYLNKYEDYADSKRREAEYERRSGELWAASGKTWEQMTKEERDAVHAECKVIAFELGLDDYGCDKRTEIRLDSTKYPEHMFKIGYWRSSYNEGGLNAVLGSTIGADLYSLHDSEPDYQSKPDWKLWLHRSQELLKAYRDYRLANGYLHVMHVSSGGTAPRRSDKAALDLFLEQRKESLAFSAYSNAAGFFSLKEPLRVYAIIDGINAIGRPCSYVIYEDKPDEKGDWYEQALEIVVETCEWVLAQSDRDKIVVSWSS